MGAPGWVERRAHFSFRDRRSRHFGFYVWQANELARRPEFRRLAVAIANERVEVLTAQDLEHLIATTEETWSTEA